MNGKPRDNQSRGELYINQHILVYDNRDCQDVFKLLYCIYECCNEKQTQDRGGVMSRVDV